MQWQNGTSAAKSGYKFSYETVVDYASLPYVVAGYYYYVKDHFGNVRVVLNENGNVEQKTNYYAFGGFDFINCSEEYIKKFEAWGEMLRDAGCGDLYDKIANSDYKVTVFESYNANNLASVDVLEYEMFFDVDSYAETNNGTIVSPALMLDHELAHLNNAIEAPLVHAIQANNVLFVVSMIIRKNTLL